MAGETSSLEWNVVVTLPEASLREARRFLRRWGEVHRTDHFRVLVLSVADPDRFLAELGKAAEETPGIFNFLAHVIPAQRTFSFGNAAEFEVKARHIALGWAPKLAGKSFHVRLHRRGLKGALSTPSEERFLDDALLEALAAAGTPGRIAFANADAIIQIETVDRRAGMSLWSREEIARYPFLGVS